MEDACEGKIKYETDNPRPSLCFLTALIYNGFNSTLDSYRGGKHDIYGSMFAGACTGALWKCTGGSFLDLFGFVLCGREIWLGSDGEERRAIPAGSR